MNKTILFAQDIVKSYKQASEQLTILKGATLSISQGEIIGLVGPSGSGKSTLLQILGLLDNYDSGSIIIDDILCNNANDEVKTKIRLNKIGFIYQNHHLLPEFTAIENIMLPLLLKKQNPGEAKLQALNLLKTLNMENRADHLPSELSGGEQQRVSIARAIITKPSIILADEPTGNLDPLNSLKIFELLIEVVKKYNLATMIVTHNMHLTKYMTRVLSISDGKIIEIDNK